VERRPVTSPATRASPAVVPTRSGDPHQARPQRAALAALVAATFVAAAPTIAAERAADLYRRPTRSSPVATAPVVRDLSELGAYPPAVPLSAEPTRFSTEAAPPTPTYPPVKGSPVPTLGLGPCGVFSDCSFEGGGIGWLRADIASPSLALGVHGAGTTTGSGIFTSAPSHGIAAILTGWDGSGPGNIVLSKDVTLQPNASRLVFDYRAGWDMFNFSGSTLPRTFTLQIQPAGGGPVLKSTTVLTALPGTVLLDTGPLVWTEDIAAYAGKSVRVRWVWQVPEKHTGPAMFQLDHIRVVEDNCLEVKNCSFETAALTNWLVSDLTNPLDPAHVAAAGELLWTNNCAPTDGAYAFVHGWDGSGPGDIRLYQDVTLPAGTSTIEFDYRAYWHNAGTLPRTFKLDVEPSGGGAPLASQTVLTAAAGTVSNTGSLTSHVDLRAFAGLPVRLVFRWHVPQNHTGPADFQLDDIRLTRGTCGSIVNCSFETGAFPAWTVLDMLEPHVPIHVGAAEENTGFGFFTSAPTDGAFALITGFDGNGPGTISAHQEVVMPLWADQLRFDYRAGWDLLTYGGGSLERTFEVAIEPLGGGPALANDVVLAARPQTQVWDTGPRSRTFPVGAFAGLPVRIVFRWRVPEVYTGPAFFQLDRVAFDNSVLAVGPGGSPGRALDLRPAIPNPSREATSFAFTLAQAGDVELEIVDVRGARVWRERHAGMPAGQHQLAWNGVRAEGGTAPAGVYYARVRTPAGSQSRMFVRVR